MRRLMLGLLLTVSVGAYAAEFGERLEQGNELLRKGDAAGAMTIFQGLQAEEPNAPDLLFSLGCAQYQLAEKDPKEAAKNLEAARDSFEKAEALSSGRLTVDAGYNRANALAQIAKQTPQGEKADPKTMQEAYQKSIQAYEQFLGRQPGHAQAQHNLDHMRYMLKQMQQNPPPPQQSQQNEDKDKQDKGDQQQQQQQQGGQGQQEKQDQQQQQQGQQNQQGEQKEQQQQDQQQQQQSQQNPQEQQQEQSQQKAQAGDEKKDHETVKSLLESLENVDQEEQKRLREAPHEQSIQEEWW